MTLYIVTFNANQVLCFYLVWSLWNKPFERNPMVMLSVSTIPTSFICWTHEDQRKNTWGFFSLQKNCNFSLSVTHFCDQKPLFFKVPKLRMYASYKLQLKSSSKYIARVQVSWKASRPTFQTSIRHNSTPAHIETRNIQDLFLLFCFDI